ncbi:MAG: hypothetical protein PHH60_04615 [Candidatus Margulisbacteria bacterium]|nr:hypothetical protein [Candidatus Margulisiibacteriota bacterium]
MENRLNRINRLRIQPIAAFLFFCLLLTAGCAPVSKEVDFSQPLKVLHNVDLDYSFINNIDQITPPYPAGSKYQIGDIPTVKGKYSVHKYIIEYLGRSAEKGEAKFHDLLVIKLDNSNKIVDAYKYTLEWADSPSLALYRMANKDVFLKPGLKLEALGLTRVVPEKLGPKAPEQRLATLPGEKKRLGDEFTADEKAYLEKADKEIEYAQARIRAGELTQSVYQSTKKTLSELQAQADFAWKGHGPEILKPALKKLDRIYQQNRYRLP